MRRTRALLSILIVLITTMICYYVLTHYEETVRYTTRLIRKYTKKTVQIPDTSYYHRTYTFKTVTETDNFKPKNIEDIKMIYYTVLNNGWDSFTFYCDINYESCVDDVRIVADSNSNEYISLINNYVSPYNSYKKFNTLIIGDDEINLSVEKLYSKDEIERLDKYITNYLDSNNIKKNSITQKDIEKVHDYLINLVTYDKDFDKNNISEATSNKATSALFEKKALCSGYTDALALFLDKMNIPNFKINTDEHEWNVIYFDKKWLHIDATWDDDEINKNNNKNFFMVTTKDLLKKDKKEHNFNEELFLELK